MKASTLLEVRGLCVTYGPVNAVHKLDLDLRDGEILALIGPNGAGKSSVLDAISGLAPHEGTVHFRDRLLSGLPPEDVAASGVARTFQNMGLFPRLTVTDNLLLGRHLTFRSGAWASVFGAPRARREERDNRRAVRQLLGLLDLQEHAYRYVDRLPYGVRKRVELGRALAMEPQVLLLDEPFAGMGHGEADACVANLHHVRSQLGLSIVLVEHDVARVLEVCDRVAVLVAGERAALGPPAAVQSDPIVRRAYLSPLGGGSG